MKILIGLSNNSFTNENKNYRMYIVEVDEITSERHSKNEWVDLDINKCKSVVM